MATAKTIVTRRTPAKKGLPGQKARAKKAAVRKVPAQKVVSGPPKVKKAPVQRPPVKQSIAAMPGTDVDEPVGLLARAFMQGLLPHGLIGPPMGRMVQNLASAHPAQPVRAVASSVGTSLDTDKSGVLVGVWSKAEHYTEPDEFEFGADGTYTYNLFKNGPAVQVHMYEAGTCQ